MSGFNTDQSLGGHRGGEGHQSLARTDAEAPDIAGIVARYPTSRAAIMPVLWKAQRKWGWLSLEVMGLVARTLELPPSHVLSVATFYTMYKKEPTGRHLIQVCHTLSCALVGADRLVAHIEQALGIKVGETTADGKFSLMRVECLAACGAGPMAQINDDFYELLTEDKMDAILAALTNDRSYPRPEVNQWTYTPVS